MMKGMTCDEISVVKQAVLTVENLICQIDDLGTSFPV